MPHAVSSRKGGAKKGAPAHQNSWGFRHNKHSKVSKRIEAIPLDNVCRRCHDQLEWRKKYRKYKPRTVLGRCNGCGQKNVKAAYIMFCEQCIADKRVCGKCGMSEDDPEYGGSGGGGGGGLVLPAGHPLQEALDDLGMDAEELLEALERGTLGLRERERRTLLRQLTSALAGEGGVEEGGVEERGVSAKAAAEEEEEGDDEEEEAATSAAAAAGSGGAGEA